MVYIAKDENKDYLVHHGIVGMHWGIRRYQNEDGSLTSAGRSRYGTPDGAKQIKKSLTEIDKESAEVQYKYKKNEIDRQKFADKATKFERRGKMKKANEFKEKAKEAEKNRDDAYKSAKKFDKQINDIINKAVKDGYNVTMTKCTRAPSAIKGKRALANVLSASGGVALGLLGPGGLLGMGIAATTGASVGLAASTTGHATYSRHGQASYLSEGFKYKVKPGEGKVNVKRDKLHW